MLKLSCWLKSNHCLDVKALIVTSDFRDLLRIICKWNILKYKTSSTGSSFTLKRERKEKGPFIYVSWEHQLWLIISPFSYSINSWYLVFGKCDGSGRKHWHTEWRGLSVRRLIWSALRLDGVSYWLLSIFHDFIPSSCVCGCWNRLQFADFYGQVGSVTYLQWV